MNLGRRNILLAFASMALLAAAINPNDHTTLLIDNDRTNPNMPEIDDEANPYYILTGEADKAIADGDYITAVLRLKDALAVDPLNPSNVMLLSNLGMIYNLLDQDSLAMKAYNQALEIAPSMTTIIGNRAMLNLKIGNENAAFQDFCTVLERDSTNVTALYYRGLISLYGSDLQTATTDFARLQQIDPDGYNTYVALSQLYTLTGREREAIPYYKKLIEADPSPEYYAALASCYLDTDDLSEANALIAEAMKQFPDDPDLYYCRAWLKRESYDLDGAHADAQRAIQLGSNPDKVSRLFKK